MTRVATAIYEDGVFKPETSVELESGARVEVVLLDPSTTPTANDPAMQKCPSDVEERIRKRFPKTYGSLTPEEGREMMRVIDEQFGYGSLAPESVRETGRATEAEAGPRSLTLEEARKMMRVIDEQFGRTTHGD